MSPLARSWLLSLGVLAASALLSHGQQPVPEDRPTVKPSKPLSRKERDQQEARKLYGIGLLHQREDRLLEAVRTLEQARQLDPEAGPVHKALITLYLALSRDNDALTACQKALDANPSDFETWYVYSRQLRERGKSKEAITALTRGLACPRVKDYPNLILQMNFELGGLYETAKDYVPAEAAFRKVAAVLENPDALVQSGGFSRVQLYGEAARTYERIGQVCLLSKKYDQAVEAFRKAQEILNDETKGKDPARADQLNRNLAEVCLVQKQPKAALEYLDQYLQKQPIGADAYELRIKVLKELGQEEEIVTSLRRYAARDRHNVALQLLLASEYARHDQASDAEKLYLEVAKQHASPEVYRGLFSLYIKDMKQPGRALDLFDAVPRNTSPLQINAPDKRTSAMSAALRQDPDLAKALVSEAASELENGKPRQRANYQLFALLAIRAGQCAQAERLYRHCLENIMPMSEGSVYFGLLYTLARAKKHEEIVNVCREGLEKSHLTPRGIFYRHRALALFQLGKTDDALRDAEEAVKLSSDQERLESRRLRVRLLSEAGQLDKAIAECQQMLKEYSLPGDIREVRLALSDVYGNARDHAKAVEQLRLVLEVSSNDALACNNLGYLLADQGKELEEAEKLIRKAIELDRETRRSKPLEDEGENAAYLDSLGWVLFRRGNAKEARVWLEKAAALPDGSDDPTVWDHLGDVYFRLEETALARTAWEKSLKLYHSDRRRHSEDRLKDVKHKLQLLETETQQK